MTTPNVYESNFINLSALDKASSHSRARTYDILINSQMLLPTELCENNWLDGVRTHNTSVNSRVLYRWATSQYYY